MTTCANKAPPLLISDAHNEEGILSGQRPTRSSLANSIRPSTPELPIRRLSRHLAAFLLLSSHAVAGVLGAATEVRVAFALERERDDLGALALSVSDPKMPSTYGE